jgi:carbon storage regulator
MLVLSRQENESIVIADRITVKVVSIRGNRVRLAIEAPKEVRVLRTELVDAAASKTAAA